jgi:molecular chaperone GrpE (heat shock protein)
MMTASLLTGQYPIQYRTENELSEKIKTGNFDNLCWDDLPFPWRSIIQGCLQVNRGDRMSMEEILKILVVEIRQPLKNDRSSEQGKTQGIISILQKELAAQLNELDSTKKRYVALAAEFDNFRKRTQREKEEQEKIIKARTITEILPAVDNFERARIQIKPNSDGENEIHKSYQGVYKNLVGSLINLGVSPIRPEGEFFDPKYHEAIIREPTAEYPEDMVIEEIVRGYFFG